MTLTEGLFEAPPSSDSEATEKTNLECDSSIEESSTLIARKKKELNREFLVKFYEEHNPQKVKDVDHILEKYEGKENHMFQKLEETYKVKIEIPSTSLSSSLNSESSSSDSVHPSSSSSSLSSSSSSSSSPKITVPKDEPVAPIEASLESNSNTSKEATANTNLEGENDINFSSPIVTEKKEALGSNESYRELLVEFYKEHNPDKIKIVNKLLKKFKGRESDMLKRMEEVYNVKIELPSTSNSKNPFGKIELIDTKKSSSPTLNNPFGIEKKKESISKLYKFGNTAANFTLNKESNETPFPSMGFSFGTRTTQIPVTENNPFILPTTEFEMLRKEHVRPLIELNDRINALTSSETKINSTRIVVAGDQSHGKTSLLEALSGVNLPRGEGIVTRVPLILQLRGTKPGEKESASIKNASSVFAQEQRIGIYQIKDKIKEFTELIAGPGKDVQNKPIEVKIYRKDQDDLTLIDLPGITRVALHDQAGGNDKQLEKLILDMCREYMTPEESILLNVVNAMVDFTTSASLALSRELDPKGSRTMLCITKVDQYKEDNFHEKVEKAITSMRLKPEHVFCVRNRSEGENKAGVPLTKIRAQEMDLLNQMTGDCAIEYQLGVKSLSKALVKRQCQEIHSILPVTLRKIQKLEKSLDTENDKLGQPMNDAGNCRGRIIQLVDLYSTRLQDEINGRLPPQSSETNTCNKKAFELSLSIFGSESGFRTETKYSNWLSFQECNFCISTKIQRNGREKTTLSVHLGVENWDFNVQSMQILCDFTVSSPSWSQQRNQEMEHKYLKPYSRGCTMKIPEKDIENATQITAIASVFVENIEYKTKATRNTDSLICSRFADAQDAFTSDVDQLYSNQFFFSNAFRKSLATEVAASRGGIGLPGGVAGHISTGVLKKLREKLPKPIDSFREKFLLECHESVEMIIDQYVDGKILPRLHNLILEETKMMLDKKAKELADYHEKLLEWESSIATTNHYFMDTVQSIRSLIYTDDSSLKDTNVSSEDTDFDKNRPAYLRHLTPEKIKLMTNQEQKLVDEQIEIFAYWKLLKKRLVDYVILSTHSELAMKALQEELKPMLLDRIFCRHNDEGLIKLMSPEEAVMKRRAGLEERLCKLREAMKEIENFRSKYIESDFFVASTAGNDVSKVTDKIGSKVSPFSVKSRSDSNVAVGSGSNVAPFSITSRTEGNSATSISFESITAMREYENKSFEEIRFEDIVNNNCP